jgi:phosphoribosyl-ATP pyrophosphohydrolase
MNEDTLGQLTQLLEQRKGEKKAKSYVAFLHAQGIDKILQKVGEESIETILAAKDAKMSGQTDEVISETADLWFHTMVMLSHLGTDTKAVINELERRFGVSGFEEKTQRQNG